MTAEQLAVIAGVVLSLVFSYVPGAKDWFEKLEGNTKRFVMLGALFVVAAGIFGLSCTPLYSYVTCDFAGAWQMLWVFVVAAIGNQTAYQLTPK